jgi:hypothetical protein
MRCYQVFGNGIAVCGHISVSSKTDFSVFQSIPTGVIVTLGVGGGGGKASGAWGWPLTFYWTEGATFGMSVALCTLAHISSWRVQGKFNYLFSLVKLTLESDLFEDVGELWYVLLHLMNELRLERVSMEPLVAKGSDARGREASGSYTMAYENSGGQLGL